MLICNSKFVRPDSKVTAVRVLNKGKNISDHRVDYIVSLGLYESYCNILILLGQDSICFRSPAKTPMSCVSTKSSFCVACSSWVLKRCNVVSGTMKPDPIFRGKQCTVLARAVHNQSQRSQREGRWLRLGHPSATLGTAYPRVAAVNLMPSQEAGSHGANSMSPCPSAYPHIPLISHHIQRKTLPLHASGNWSA